MKVLVVPVTICVMLALIGWALYLRFSNPAMTETQLFLAFWPWYLLNTVVFGGLRFLLEGAGRMRR